MSKSWRELRRKPPGLQATWKLRLPPVYFPLSRQSQQTNPSVSQPCRLLWLQLHLADPSHPATPTLSRHGNQHLNPQNKRKQDANMATPTLNNLPLHRRRVEGFLDSTKVRTCSVSFPWLIRFPVVTFYRTVDWRVNSSEL